jgi:hypothetical protein
MMKKHLARNGGERKDRALSPSGEFFPVDNQTDGSRKVVVQPLITDPWFFGYLISL